MNLPCLKSVKSLRCKPMIEAPGLFSKILRFDGTTLEIVSHGQTTGRFDVKSIKEIKRTDDNGGLIVNIFCDGAWTTFGFKADQRATGETLLTALEAARA